MSVRIQLRRDTAANWTATNPTLTQGEPGYETDTGKIKYGDGSTAWNSLAYASGGLPAAFAAGTAAAPGFAVDGDSNTGIYSPGADQLAISTGGARRVQIDSNGYVQLAGQSSWYSGSVEIVKSVSYGSSSDASLILGGTDNGYVDNGRTSAWRLLASGSNSGQDFTIGGFLRGGTWQERLRITSAGLVGIGSSTPVNKLDVNGSISAAGSFSNTGYAPAVHVGLSGGNPTIASGNNVTSTYLPLVFTRETTTGSAESMRIDASGRLGIGTSTPSKALEVAVGSSSALRISRVGAGEADFSIDASGNVVYDAGISDGHIFRVDGGVERCRLDSSGRLLVGTSSAFGTTSRNSYYSLTQIRGNTSGSDSDGRLSLGTSTASASVTSGKELGRIVFTDGDGGDYAYVQGFADGTAGSGDYPGRIVLATTADGASSPSTRMTLFSNGNIRAVETASAYFYPGIDNSIYLGSPSFRYNLVYSVNGTASSSDEREKTEINDAALGIDFIKSLRPVSYKWKVGHNDVEAGDEGDVVIPRPGLRTHWGFLAQDVKQAADQAGVDFGGWILTDVDDPESPQGLRYQQFIAPLTKALQEAIAKIETLEAKVAALEAS